MSTKTTTVGEAIDEFLYRDDWSHEAKLADQIARALGIDPDTPLDRLHVLRDGERIVRLPPPRTPFKRQELGRS